MDQNTDMIPDNEDPHFSLLIQLQNLNNVISNRLAPDEIILQNPNTTSFKLYKIVADLYYPKALAIKNKTDLTVILKKVVVNLESFTAIYKKEAVEVKFATQIITRIETILKALT